MWIVSKLWILCSAVLGRCPVEESLLQLYLLIIKELQVNKRCLKIKVLQVPGQLLSFSSPFETFAVFTKHMDTIPVIVCI